MDPKIFCAALGFKGFRLEFLIDINESIFWTDSFSATASPDFVFAVGDVRVALSGSDFIFIEQQEGENLLIFLKDLKRFCDRPARVVEIEKLINSGGWCAWMNEYWRGQYSENSHENDNAYDALIPALFAESEQGRMALYFYDESPVIEIGVELVGSKYIYFEKYERDFLKGSIDSVISDISNKILECISLKGASEGS